MRNTVFLDNLPQQQDIVTPWHEQYRAVRNLALADMLVRHPDAWSERCCPACRKTTSTSNFSRTILPFEKCLACGTIYSKYIPDQRILDAKRVSDLPDHWKDIEPGAANARETEFNSLINWITLRSARHSRPIAKILDFRFSSHARGWKQATETIEFPFEWRFLPIRNPDEISVNAQLHDELEDFAPDAVTVFSEIDRYSNPAGLLDSLYSKLKSGALVFIATSCSDGLEYQLLGSESPSFIPLDRLNLFSIQGFSQLALQLGFQVVEASTPGRLDAVILQKHFMSTADENTPFWPGFFRDAQRDQLQDLQTLLQRSRRSGVMRFVLEKL